MYIVQYFSGYKNLLRAIENLGIAVVYGIRYSSACSVQILHKCLADTTDKETSRRTTTSSSSSTTHWVPNIWTSPKTLSSTWERTLRSWRTRALNTGPGRAAESRWFQLFDCSIKNPVKRFEAERVEILIQRRRISSISPPIDTLKIFVSFSQIWG